MPIIKILNTIIIINDLKFGLDHICLLKIYFANASRNNKRPNKPDSSIISAVIEEGLVPIKTPLK